MNKLYKSNFIFITMLVIAFISCNKKNIGVKKITAQNIAVNDSILPSKEIDSVVKPYKKALNEEMSKVLSYAPIEFNKNNIGMQSYLGNLMADMCYDMANPLYKEKMNASIDFAMFNNGGLRAPVLEGNVTKESAFKLMPFENALVVVQLSGNKIKELVDYFIRNKKAHPLSKNISLNIKKKGYSLTINGKSFDENKTYSVLTSDYLQGGGDRMYFFKEPIKLTKLDYKVRDAILDYFSKVDTLNAKIDKRIIVKS